MELFGSRIRILRGEDIPLPVDYETPDTLGVDRKLFAFGAREFYTQDAVLVMAGTALVVDLLLEGVLRGGFITAGVSLKLKALSEYTEGIPLYSPAPSEEWIGRNTEAWQPAGLCRRAGICQF